MDLILNSTLLLGTFYLLAIVCDKYFVPTLEIIAYKLKMNSEMAGATLMAVGSSAPELFTSLFAIFTAGDGVSSLGAGTIVGSAIFNILVIIGVSALYMTKKDKLAWQPVIRDMIFYSITIMSLLLFFWDGKVELWETGVLVFMYAIYLLFVKNWRKWFKYEIKEEQSNPFEELCELPKNRIEKLICILSPFIRKHYIIGFVLSISLIAILSYFMVESAIEVATILDIPAAIIGLTILAAGTSVPDLISSIIVAKKGKADMAVSNAVGSNVFDILVGIGLVYLLYLSINDGSINVDTDNLLASVFLLFATVVAILTVLIMQKWRLGKYSGLLLITLYIGYLVYNVLKATGII